ncbi:hypothetical protein IV203_030238 [Nitzschia inconspicua]|uniref:Uncharacterized protein n=1 Tax=Nitzschia inconspicua TaxID=303405 RepID=A0A9K3LSX6_9STRA|nr:hypothetical protein IV203_030238 [Nitzschia inconspicua]
MDDAASSSKSWIHLGQADNCRGKEFSRLLYPNPVCFLCHRSVIADSKPKDVPTPEEELINGEKTERNGRLGCLDNVMVVSWLTPTNNHGKFLMSLNKRRCTAQSLVAAFLSTSSSSTHSSNDTVDKKAKFTLCVPIAGMEELVLAVGCTSGRFACKFGISDDIASRQKDLDLLDTNNPTSNRKVKKRRQLQFEHGIPNLVQASFGSPKILKGDGEGQFDTVFCVEGTVAHLLCVVDQVLGVAEHSGNENAGGDDAASQVPVVDQDHFLVSGTVVDAYCQAGYWDQAKKLFRPRDPSISPYLKFLGSQSFGYVTSKE